MGKEKMRIGLLASLAGALLAYLIGSGTASGQESMQYFTSWGSVGVHPKAYRSESGTSTYRK